MHGAHLGDIGDQLATNMTTLSTSALRRHQDSITMRDVVLDPQEILALYASEAQLDRGHTVTLHSVQCQNQNIFLVVETTCPLHRVQAKEMEKEETVLIDMNDYPMEDEEMFDTTTSTKDMEKSVVPDWLKSELKEAESEEKQRK